MSSLTIKKLGFCEDVRKSVNKRFPNSCDVDIFDDRDFSVDCGSVVLSEEIARGSYGIVYNGLCNGNSHAIKLEDFGDGEDQVNLLVELSILQSLPHERLVQFFGAGYLCKRDGDAKMMIVMELCNKGALREGMVHLMPPNGVPLWPLIVRLALDTALGIQFLHEHSIIHRDIKTTNVLIDDHWRAKLCDFSFCCHAESSSKMEYTYGTEEFMSPEIALGLDFGIESDIFSFGILLCEMITGLEPSETFLKRLPRDGFAVNEAELRDLVKDNCPEELHAMALACSDCDPAYRPTIQRCVEELQLMLAGVSGGNENIPLPEASDSRVDNHMSPGASQLTSLKSLHAAQVVCSLALSPMREGTVTCPRSTHPSPMQQRRKQHSTLASPGTPTSALSGSRASSTAVTSGSDAVVDSNRIRWMELQIQQLQAENLRLNRDLHALVVLSAERFRHQGLVEDGHRNLFGGGRAGYPPHHDHGHSPVVVPQAHADSAVTSPGVVLEEHLRSLEQRMRPNDIPTPPVMKRGQNLRNVEDGTGESSRNEDHDSFSHNVVDGEHEEGHSDVGDGNRVHLDQISDTGYPVSPVSPRLPHIDEDGNEYDDIMCPIEEIPLTTELLSQQLQQMQHQMEEMRHLMRMKNSDSGLSAEETGRWNEEGGMGKADDDMNPNSPEKKLESWLDVEWKMQTHIHTFNALVNKMVRVQARVESQGVHVGEPDDDVQSQHSTHSFGVNLGNRPLSAGSHRGDQATVKNSDIKFHRKGSRHPHFSYAHKNANVDVGREDALPGTGTIAPSPSGTTPFLHRPSTGEEDDDSMYHTASNAAADGMRHHGKEPYMIPPPSHTHSHTPNSATSNSHLSNALQSFLQVVNKCKQVTQPKDHNDFGSGAESLSGTPYSSPQSSPPSQTPSVSQSSAAEGTMNSSLSNRNVLDGNGSMIIARAAHDNRHNYYPSQNLETKHAQHSGDASTAGLDACRQEEPGQEGVPRAMSGISQGSPDLSEDPSFIDLKARKGLLSSYLEPSNNSQDVDGHSVTSNATGRLSTVSTLSGSVGLSHRRNPVSYSFGGSARKTPYNRTTPNTPNRATPNTQQVPSSFRSRTQDRNSSRNELTSPEGLGGEASMFHSRSKPMSQYTSPSSVNLTWKDARGTPLARTSDNLPDDESYFGPYSSHSPPYRAGEKGLNEMSVLHRTTLSTQHKLAVSANRDPQPAHFFQVDPTVHSIESNKQTRASKSQSPLHHRSGSTIGTDNQTSPLHNVGAAGGAFANASNGYGRPDPRKQPGSMASGTFYEPAVDMDRVSRRAAPAHVKNAFHDPHERATGGLHSLTTKSSPFFSTAPSAYNSSSSSSPITPNPSSYAPQTSAGSVPPPVSVPRNHNAKNAPVPLGQARSRSPPGAKHDQNPGCESAAPQTLHQYAATHC